MKTKKCISLFLTILCCVVSAYAEGYKPIILEDNKWNIVSFRRSIATSGEFYEITETFTVSGDTLVESVLYKKLFRTENSPDELGSIAAFVRENTDEQKVYVKYPDKPEKLLYDFGVNKGDTIKIISNLSFSTEHYIYLIIQSVDRIDIGGVSHKRLKVESRTDNARPEESGYIHTWIEGVGDMNGLLNSTIPYNEIDGGTVSALLCFYKDGSFFYKNEESEYDDCFVWEHNRGIETLKKTSDNFNISIVKDKLFIKPHGTINYDVTVFSLTGNELVKQVNCSGPACIGLGNLSKGISILKIGGESQSFTQKILIE